MDRSPQEPIPLGPGPAPDGLPFLPQRTFASLRYPTYRLYFFGQAFSLVGLWMQSAAQSWLVYDLTGSKAFLGAVGIIGSVPIVVFSTWGGILADRVPKRRILVTTSLCAAFLALVLGLITLADIVQPLHIALLAGLLGVVAGVEMPARQAFAAELVGKEHLGNAIALNASVFHAARIVGPALAGIIIGQVGPGWAFIGNAMSFGAILWALGRMRIPGEASGRPPGPASGRWHGFRVVRDTPGLAALLLLLLGVGSFGWSYVVLMPALARDRLGTGPEGYGILMSSIGVGSVIGALILAGLGTIRRPRPVLCAIVLGMAASLVLLAVSRVQWVAALVLLPAGFFLTVFFSLTNTWVQTAVPDEVRGRVMGVYSLVFGALMPLGSLWAGLMAETIGVPSTIVAGAGLCIIAILLLYRFLPRSMEDRTEA